MKLSLPFFFTLFLLTSGHANPTWLVIGKPDFVAALKPLVEHRKSQGFRVETADGPIKEGLAKFKNSPPDYILLLGDATVLPGAKRSLYRWQATQSESYVSDTAFGDFDQDDIPEVPIGRLPVNNLTEVVKAARKIVAYETAPHTVNDLSLPVWAGDPNYGGMFQAAMASNLLRSTLAEHAPKWAELWLMMGNPSDPLSAWPPAHPDLFNKRLIQGGVMAGMMGHGNASGFYSMPHQKRWITYETRHTADLTIATSPAAPTVIFACDCGNFAWPETSLSEALFHSPGGPVAVMAATTQSHPLPNYYSSVSLLQELALAENRTIGDLWTATQRRGYTMRNPLVEGFLANIEGKLEAKLDTPRIRKDHLLLYALLGDPATRLRLPKKLPVEWTLDGARWNWKVDRPKGAKELEITHRLSVPPLPLKQSGTQEEAIQQFEQANADLKFKKESTFSKNQAWEGTLAHPGVYRFLVQTRDSIWVSTKEIR